MEVTVSCEGGMSPFLLRRRGRSTALRYTARGRPDIRGHLDDPYHQFIKQFLASNKAEALEWLRAAPDDSFRNLGEMEPDESIQFVQRLYDLGAEKVLVFP